MALVISNISTPGFIKTRFVDQMTLDHGLYIIRGENGLGKSVFVNSVIGYYGIRPGICAVGNVGTGGVSYFAQDSYACTDSLYWNVFLTRERVSPEKISLAETLIGEFKLDGHFPSLSAPLSPALLSGGQLKKIGLTRAICKSADLYLFDEPTNDLDKASRAVVALYLQRISLSAVVVVITHDEALLASSCHFLSIF